MRPRQRRQVTRHQLEQDETAQKSKGERAEKSFPRLLCANLRHHQMPANRAASQIRAHVAELRDRNQIETIKLPRYNSAARSRREIENFGGKIEKPEHVKQSEQRVSHRLQRFVVPQTGKHLPAKHRQQEKE